MEVNSWAEFYNNRAEKYRSPEEIGLHYIDGVKVTSDFRRIEVDRISALFGLPVREGSEVLDLGCGAGFSSGMLREIFQSVHGIDLGINTIARAREFYPEIRFSIDDIVSLESINDMSCSYIFLYGVIYNMGSMEKIEECIKTIERISKPGGRTVICKIPNSSFFEAYQKYRRKRAVDQGYKESVRSDNSLEWVWLSYQNILKMAGDKFDVTFISAPPGIDFPFSAWFDCVLVKRQ